MELARSAVWNHHEVMYGINPKGDTRWRVMPCAYGDYILTCGEITYQSFGLDRKKQVFRLAFFWLGWPDLNRRVPESKSGALPLGDIPITRILYHAFGGESSPFFDKLLKSWQFVRQNRSRDEKYRG